MRGDGNIALSTLTCLIAHGIRRISGGSDDFEVDDEHEEEHLSSSGEDLTQYSIPVAAVADEDASRPAAEIAVPGAPVVSDQKPPEDEEDEMEDEDIVEEDIEFEEGAQEEEEELYPPQPSATATSARPLPSPSPAAPQTSSAAPLKGADPPITSVKAVHAAALDTVDLASSIEDLMQSISPMIPPGGHKPPSRHPPTVAPEAVRGHWPAMLPYSSEDDAGPGAEEDEVTPKEAEAEAGEYTIDFDDAAIG